MDSSTLLDYALFQLTPTRTRCDLVLFSGKRSEKIASGLLEPFLSHLKSAKDQISKGGYSIMLKPTSVDTSPWFTKAILERFVRFVSTPEVLERVVTIEREINQIESSNEQVHAGISGTDRDFRFPAAPFKSKSETNGDDNAEAEENPKIHLRRVLESRKAMLKKEQAMAYARALVAGFEMDCIYDLVSFSDAFGALRLREACINFMEVCDKKNNDTIWLDEVAAMQTIFTGENNELYQTGPAKSSASDSGEGTEFNLQHTERVAQSPTWQNNLPQYMQSSQGPMFQRHQSYPGYIFPGPPPHYPGPRPVNFHDSDMYLDRDIKDSKRYRSKNLARRHSRKDEGEEIDQSSSGSDSSEEQDHEEASLSPTKPIHSKKNHRKSSRKVVIRNINYIASATNDDSGGDSDSKNEARYDSKKSINKSKVSEEESKGGNWDIFQNILMKDSDSSDKVTESKNIQFQEEYSTGKKLDKPKHASDDFLPIGTPARNGIQRSNVSFEDGEVLHRAVQRTKDEEFLMPSRGGGYNSQSARFGTESSIIKTSNEEDWIKTEISSNARGSTHHNTLHGEEISTNHFRDGENKRRVLSDDSFMVQSRLSDGTLQSQPKADIFMAPDIVGANQSENSTHGKVESRRFSEPEDLSMMLGQSSAALEMDYRNDISLYETVGNQTKTEPGDAIDATLLKNGKSSNIKSRNELRRKVAGKEPKSKAPTGSLLRSKSDIPLRSKISTSGSTRGKAEKEEEKRKRMEELAIQRQKRIAERSAAKGTAQEIPKVHTRERKKKSPSTTEKSKLQAPTVEKKTSHKPVMKSSTIDRLATARTTNKKPSTESKAGQNRKPASKASSSMAPSSTRKPKETQEQKDKIDKKISSNNSRSTSNDQGKDRKSATPVVSEDSRRTERTQTETKDGNKDFGMDTASVEKRESATVSTKDASEEKNSIRILPDKVMLPLEDSSMPKEKQLNGAPQITEHAPTAENNLKSAPSISNEKVVEKKKLSFSPEISVMNISTPPSDSEASAELMQPRKKWNNGESSPKIPKGFRKLIFFGRRS